MARLPVVLSMLIALAAFPAHGASVSKSYSYFSIGGSDLGEIEAELGRRGPQVGGAGKRHPGATRMKFNTRLGYREQNGRCRIVEARVSVDARVILPRWKRSRKADEGTRLIWDTLASDIKRHEESHVIIAKNHARELEEALKALRPRRDCAEMERAANQTSAQILAKHDRAQQQFDRVEGMNFENRLLMLLEHRMERDAAR